MAESPRLYPVCVLENVCSLMVVARMSLTSISFQPSVLPDALPQSTVDRVRGVISRTAKTRGRPSALQRLADDQAPPRRRPRDAQRRSVLWTPAFMVRMHRKRDALIKRRHVAAEFQFADFDGYVLPH